MPPNLNGTRKLRLLEQLSYVRDEIASLSTFSNRIDSGLLAEQPLNGAPSILESFRLLSTGQVKLAEKYLIPEIKGPLDDDESLSYLLDIFVTDRSALVESLQTVVDATREAGLSDDILDLVISESEILRAVTERLYESNLFRI